MKLEDLKDKCTLEILKPPSLERIAHDELDEFNPEEEKEATPALVKSIGEMLLDLGFEEENLKERIQKFEERIGVPVNGRVNWTTYWRLLYCNDGDEYEKRKTATLKPSEKSRRQTMIPSDFYKSRRHS